MANALIYITIVIYAVVTASYAAYLITHRQNVLKASNYGFMAGIAVHAAAILSRWASSGRFPLTNLHESLSFFAFCSALIFLAFFLSRNMAVLGAFVAPFALLLTLTSTFLPTEIVPLSPVLSTYWLPFHVSLAIIGNAFFALACLFGIMYIIQDKYLKSRKIHGLYFVLPSLETLDELNYRCLTLGFPLLTLGIITGAIWSQYAFGTYWIWKHRQVWSLITWLMYALLLHGRITANWRGRKSAAFSIIGFIVLIGTSLIIYALLGEGHGLLTMQKASQ